MRGVARPLPSGVSDPSLACAPMLAFAGSATQDPVSFHRISSDMI